jgi:hypothetical protein
MRMTRSRQKDLRSFSKVKRVKRLRRKRIRVNPNLRRKEARTKTTRSFQRKKKTSQRKVKHQRKWTIGTS